MSDQIEKFEAQQMTTREQSESVLDSVVLQHAVEFPAPSAIVLSLTSLLGYECDRPTIDKYFKSGQLTKPARNGSALRWDRERVILLCELLESDRRWRPKSRHDHKKLDHELERDRADEAWFARHVSDWMIQDVSVVVSAVANAETLAMRQMAAGVLLHRLGRTE